MKANFDEILVLLTDLLDRLKIKYVVIGGVAVSYWSEPRSTKDLDLTILVDEQGWINLSRELKKMGAKFNTSQTPEGETIPDLVRMNLQGELVDLQMSKTPYQNESIRRGLKRKCREKKVRVASAEDLFVLKLLASRPLDLVDLESLTVHNPKLDFDYITKWCQEWEMQDRLEKFFKDRQR